MESEYLKQHLAKADLSFTTIINKEVISIKENEAAKDLETKKKSIKSTQETLKLVSCEKNIAQFQKSTGRDAIKQKSIIAYVDDNGRLLIETPLATTYTIYPSINQYNKRLCIPDFSQKFNIDVDKMNSVFINMETLVIDNNPK
ncbi:MAG: hypothetical protein M3Q58_03620 [Bacteroidota bacterium]|nr:hypothetical protein [Bacteroidota bacterium]